MTDYCVVAADGSRSFGTFDKYGLAIQLHSKLSKKQSVNLLCLHGCGCVYRAIVKGWTSKSTGTEYEATHTGWRRAEACAKHKRAVPLKSFLHVATVMPPEPTQIQSRSTDPHG